MSQIIIDVGLQENRVAVMENAELVELYIEKDDNKRTVGNIYKGRVVNVLPGMQAAFVDIGLEKNAFLYVKDAIPKEMLSNKRINLKDISIKDVIKSGQDIVVQVIKEPFGNKGARVTTHITIPGRHIVLMPYTDYIGVSRRINDETERNRLREIIESVKPANMGLILRTASEGLELEDFKEDIRFLLKVLNKIDSERNLGFAPRVMYKDLDLIHRTVRDLFTNNIGKLIINSRDEYKSIVELIEMISPQLKSRVEYFDSSHDIFGYFGIEQAIHRALDRKVWLKSGGYVVIDETEALTSIDVNTGKYVGSIDLEDTVLRTNMEAAREIAKQLRLRNIGGIIIIDFIDMNNELHEKEVLEVLENELKKDRTKSTVLGMTQLGLVEMTRKKVRSRLTTNLLMECPYCNGTGKVYSESSVLSLIDKEAKRLRLHTSAEAAVLEVNPHTEGYLRENNNYFIKRIEEEYGIKLFVRANQSIHHNEVRVKNIGKIDFIKGILGE
ncbi:Rne/Rng family ribonuclease [Proteiniborus sp. MB09-C3]|uniref:Rne/Rng family ribonuclease n=1 Tax=Proteiniborus sp. MB09-C3 TaxID=3050072 RepID=UPI002553BDCE|nr:Rne/Rng family ribonuclease [Proteiniborus sp. MB09-C3]WIV10609.1 Rne/Rng family ribonuclease [Proteiniborus sp. MB09-C3]